jgi:hypothetical protein
MAQGGGQGELIGLVHLDYRGTRHVLGRTADAYAIWDAAGGPPRQTFPLSDEGWIQAWQEYQRLEASAAWTAPPSGPTGPGGMAPGGPARPGGMGPAGPGVPGGMAPGGEAYALDYPGGRYGLGRAQGQYIIWDLQTQAGVRAFPLTDEGWAEAWRTFRELDEPYTFVPTTYWQKGRPIPIRAMRAGQIVSATFKLYFMYFWVLIAVIAAVFVPLGVVSGALTIATLEPLTVDTGFGAVQSVQNPPWVTIVNAVLFLLAVPFITASVLAAIAETSVGRRVTVGSAYRVGFRKALPVLWVSFLLALAILVLFLPAAIVAVISILLETEPSALFALSVVFFIAAIPFAIFLSVRFFFGTSAVVIEGRRGVGALRRSWQLVRGLSWKVFGNYLLIGLIQAGITFVFLLIGLAVASALFLRDIFSFTGVPSVEAFRDYVILSSVLNAVISVILTPFSTLAIVLLYFDSRVRKEGFSEQVLAREWESRSPSGIFPAAAPPPGPAPPAGP